MTVLHNDFNSVVSKTIANDSSLNNAWLGSSQFSLRKFVQDDWSITPTFGAVVLKWTKCPRQACMKSEWKTTECITACWFEVQVHINLLKPECNIGGLEWILINLLKSAAFSLQTWENNPNILRINLKGTFRFINEWPLERACVHKPMVNCLGASQQC